MLGDKAWGLYVRGVIPSDLVGRASSTAKSMCTRPEGDQGRIAAGLEVDKRNGPELWISCSGNCLGCRVTELAMGEVGEQITDILGQPIETKPMKLPRALSGLANQLG